MYLMPPFISPFSTIETINEEKNDIMEIATIEKTLKSYGFTLIFENTKGKAAMPLVAEESWDTKLSIRISKWKERAKSRGLITITITDMKITYAIAAAERVLGQGAQHVVARVDHRGAARPVDPFQGSRERDAAGDPFEQKEGPVNDMGGTESNEFVIR